MAGAGGGAGGAGAGGAPCRRGRGGGGRGPGGGRGGGGVGEPQERGDPMSPLRWTVKSTRKLAAELTGQGHKVGADTVGDLLRQEGFSLQANAKTVEGKQHADRDAQFRDISEQARARPDPRDPVVSGGTQTKELAGA